MIALGVQFSVGGSRIVDTIEAALAFEAAGFESVWVGSHLIDYYDPQRSVPECLVAVSALVTATHRINVGSLAIPSFHVHPALLAQIAGSLDEFSEGRFQLGIGAGGTRDEYLALGMGFPRRGERVQRLRTTLCVLRSLREGGPVDADIDTVSLRRAWCRPTFERTPIVVATLGRRTAQLAGALADEVNTIDYAHGFDALQVVKAARMAAASVGRTVRASLMVPDRSETLIGGGPHPNAGLSRAAEVGVDRLIFRVVPPYPSPEAVLDMAHAGE